MPRIPALFILSAFLSAALAAPSAHVAESWAKVIVFPFENGSPTARSQDYLSLGLASALAEGLDAETGFVVLNGRFPILTKDQAEARTIEAMARVAAAKGATHFVTGRFSGQVWKWKLGVTVYAVSSGSPVAVGSYEMEGDQTVAVTTQSGRILRPVSGASIQKMLSATAELAFSRAGLPLSEAVRAALEIPSSSDGWANILLARAYERHFSPVDPSRHRDALTMAAQAVNVDPTSVEAQRFYAWLLEQAGKDIKARLHYEEVLKRKPADFRSLVRLGHIEVKARNFDDAKAYLKKAVELKPGDPEPRFGLGLAYARMGKPGLAIAEFEAARNLDPSDMATRRELTALYQDADRHAEAARELHAIADAEPKNLDSAFELAATLRRAGDIDGAILALKDAGARFPQEARLRKFRGDMLRIKMEYQAARLAYEEAAAIDPRDKRIAQVMSADERNPATLIGGPELVAAVRQSRESALDIERVRANVQAAANDAAEELRLHGKESCEEGGASARLARTNGDDFRKKFEDIDAAAAAIRAALKDGEGSALTADERRLAQEALAATERYKRDVAEMKRQYDETVLALLDRNGCPEAVASADPRDITKRNEARHVTLPEVSSPRSPLAIAPEIRPQAARVIRFHVDNTTGRADYALFLDRQKLGDVPAGSKTIFTAAVGHHELCLIVAGETCGAPGTVRRVSLHEGWILQVRNGRRD